MRNFPNKFYPDVSRAMAEMGVNDKEFHHTTEKVLSKMHEAMEKVITAENSIIIEAVNSYFGNNDFDSNAKLCRGETDPITNAKRVFNGDTLICEIHPMKSSSTENGIVNLSFNYYR
jgi:hypothetical protein